MSKFVINTISLIKKMIEFCIVILMFIVIMESSMKNNMVAQELNSGEIEKKVDELISKLTLEEKASLCSGRDDWSTQPIERLDIPWIWLSDGPHGLRRAPETNKAGYGDHIKLPYISRGEISKAQIDELVEKCKNITYTP